ncbi:GNAT family N-acetyltransferase [Halosimplex pelagicum]|uniref:GNAT family N-acetyltransferase n=1 Tax=Halosimplex pelagicum TaxID=869886 RepID=A0A7D5SXS5_9EURY|nr:GNAT family N-acetyltransferase [Halosimplex pelagicum]QLH84187.1 GNAT family N-acetyltransferase [Halosimplex pelagicum]
MSMVEPTDLTVRRYRAGDGDRVRELNREAMAETPEWAVDAPDTDLDDVRDHYIDAGGEFLVGELDGGGSSESGPDDGDIVATGAVEPLDGWMAERFDAAAGTGELSRVRVDPAMQGQGIGTRIVEELARRARRRGYRALVLNTGADNEQARGFYESLGYACVREETVDFDDVTLDLALYWRRVDG